MNDWGEEVDKLVIAILFVIALTMCWLCSVAVSWELFLPLAAVLTVIAGIVIIVVIKKGKR